MPDQARSLATVPGDGVQPGRSDARERQPQRTHPPATLPPALSTPRVQRTHSLEIPYLEPQNPLLKRAPGSCQACPMHGDVARPGQGTRASAGREWPCRTGALRRVTTEGPAASSALGRGGQDPADLVTRVPQAGLEPRVVIVKLWCRE